jgi:hypothetical protein
VAGARDLVRRLVDFDAAALDASGGTVPAHVAAFDAVRPVDDVDERRLAITRATIEHGMLTYPPLVRFPAVENAGWQAINDALRGERAPGDVPALVQAAAVAALGDAS